MKQQRSNSRKKQKENLSGNTSYNTGKPSGSRNSSKGKKQAPQIGKPEPINTGLQSVLASMNLKPQDKFFGVSRQLPLMSDLYHSSTQQQREISLLFRDVDMPDDDESLSISTISQQHSPFPTSQRTQQQPPVVQKNRTSTQQAISDVLKTQYEHSTGGELTTLGRASEDGTGTLKQMFLGNTNGHGRQQQQQEETIISDRSNEEEFEESMGIEERKSDSPDFNRLQNNSDDQLSVSQSVMFSHQEATPLSQRDRMLLLSKQNNNSKSNKSFAENVLNLNQYTSSQTNSHRDTNRRLGTHRRRENEDSPRIQEETSSNSSQEIDRENVMVTRNNNMDTSEMMSAIDSFAQTHYSKMLQNSNLALSRYVPKRENATPSSMTAMTPGGITADGKSPQIYRKTDSSPANGGDSMSLTPSVYEGRQQQWGLTQKSYLTANNVSQISNNLGALNILSRVQNDNEIIMPGGDNISTHTGGQNRTVSSDNSSNLINRFTAPKQQNRTDMGRTSRNGGIGRDQELENALETGIMLQTKAKDEAYSTLKRATTLEEDSSSMDGCFKVTQLNMEIHTLKAQLHEFTTTQNQKDELISDLEHRCLQLDTDLREKNEYLELMKVKFNQDEASLQRLRQRNLEAATRKIGQLEKEKLSLAQMVQQLEDKVMEQERDEKMVAQAYKVEIGKLSQLLDTKMAIIKGKEREKYELAGQNQEKLEKQRQDYDSRIQEIKEMLEESKRKERDLNKTQRQQQADLSRLVSDIESLKSQLDSRANELSSRDQTITQLKSQISQEREKSQSDLKHYKERCKTLETELEQMRSFESSTINHMKQQQYSKANDFEIKKFKQMYDKIIANLNEDLRKKSDSLQDAENDIKRLKEQVKHSAQNDFQQDIIKTLQHENQRATQDLHTLREDLQKAYSDLHTAKQLESDIRLYFGLSEVDELAQILAKASQAMGQVPILENEIRRLVQKIEEMQRQMIDQVNSSMASVQSLNVNASMNKQSDFLTKIMFEKDKQNKELSKKLEELREHSLTQDLQLSRLTTDLAHQRNLTHDLTTRLENVNSENQQLQEGKFGLEAQIEELKERQRVTHRENITLQGQITQIKEEQLGKEDFQGNYQSILRIIEEYGVEKVYDEESARKCLEQVKVYGNERILEVSQKLEVEQQTTKVLKVQINDFERQIQTLTQNLKQTQRENLEKETNFGQIVAENQTIKEQCDRLMTQLKEVEQHSISLRQESEQAKANLRKALRAQETAKSYLPKQPTISEVRDSVELERIMMKHEEELARAHNSGIEEGQNKAVQTLKNLMIAQSEIEPQAQSDPISAELLQLLNLVKRHHTTQQSTQNRMSAAALSNIKHSSNNHNNDLDDSCLLEIQDNFQEELTQAHQRIFTLTTQLQDHQSTIQSLELVLTEKDISITQLNDQLTQVSEQLVQAERGIKALADEVRYKERLIKECELKLQQKTMECEEQVREVEQKAESDRIRLEQEHLAKIALIDAQSSENQRVRELQANEFGGLKREQEAKYQKKMSELEKEFIAKLQKAEGEMAKMSEQNKEDIVSQLYKRSHQEKEQALNAMKADYEAQLSTLKQDHTQKLLELKKQQEKDVKKLKDESDRTVRTIQEKFKKTEAEWQTEKELIERENSQKVEILNQKNKTAIKVVQDKAKSESRNQVDQVKNEMARAKAEFEREKKKLVSDNTSQIELLNSDLQDLRVAKEKQERVHRKKFDDATAEHQKVVSQLEEQLRTLHTNHQTEFAKVKERVEVQLREIVKAEIRNEVTEEIEGEYKAEVQRLIEKHRVEMEKMRLRQQEQLDRVEKACSLPKAHENVDKRDRDVQCDILPLEQQKPVFNRFDLLEDSPTSSVYNNRHHANNSDPDNTGLVVINQSSMYSPSDDIIEYARNPHLNGKQDASENLGLIKRDKEIEAKLRKEHQTYVEQLKMNYEDELERQQHVFESQLASRQCQTARVSEELMTLELDKILQSIYLRNEPMKLDSRRREINNLVNDILMRNDDPHNSQLKLSLDQLKRKVSEVLTSFKQELESRFQKKLDTAVRESMQLNQQVRDSMQIPINMMGEIRRSTQQYTSSYDSQSEPVVMTQQSPARQYEHEVKPFIAEQNSQFSEVKNYVTLEDEPNYSSQDPQILRRIAPTINNKGLLTVEVSKVLRDLKMIQRTLKGSKFFKMLTEGNATQDENSVAENEEDHEMEEQRGSSHESNLEQYRKMLNSIIRSVVILNKCTEQMAKSQEIYRVKLVNADLRENLQKLQSQIDGNSVTLISEDIATYYSGNSQAYELLNFDSQKCLSHIEASLFSINKQHFKLFQLNDLFIREKALNRNLVEVNKACSEYVRSHTLEQEDGLKASQFQPNQDQILETLTSSQYSPEKLKLVPEMLSPEDVAHLLASIFSKMSHPSQDPGFFTTLLSTEDNIKSAESFFQRYREHLYPYNNMPLQVTQRSHDTQMFTKQINFLSENTQQHHRRGNFMQEPQRRSEYRSESRSNSNPRSNNGGLMNTAVTNVFSQGMKHNGSIKSFNNMPLQQQQHFQSITSNDIKPQLLSTTTAPTTVSKANHPYQSIQLKASNPRVQGTASTGSLFNAVHGSSVEEAQSKVNQLFDRMRYNTSAPENGGGNNRHPQFFFSK